MAANFKEEKNKINNDECPSCSAKLVHQEGCVICKNCGWGLCND